MTKFFLFLVSVLAIILLVLVKLVFSQGQDIPFHTIASGENSQITQREMLVIHTQEEWNALWQKHSAHELAPAPSVDFTHEMVIAVFEGATTWPVPPEIVKIKKYGQEIIITVGESMPPQGYLGPAFPFARPFQIIRLQRSTLPIRFETIFLR